MIPQIIHYCWLSDDPIPTDLEKCMKTWKEHLPDYEFIKWDFTRFDKNSSKWVHQAFEAKKYAFAADYIRLYALYHYGGIYLDMDVEVIKSLNPFLELSTMIGFENSDKQKLEAAVVGVEKHSKCVNTCLSYYENRSFIHNDGTFDVKVLPYVLRDQLIESGYNLKSVSSIDEEKRVSDMELPVFPFDFFSPKSYLTGKIEKTCNTVTIHNFSGSWQSKNEIVRLWLKRHLPLCVQIVIRYAKNIIKI